MSFLNAIMYKVNKDAEINAKMNENNVNTGTMGHRIAHRLIIFPSSVIRGGLASVFSTAARATQLACHIIALAACSVAMLCTLGCHEDTRKYFLSSLKGVGVSIFQLVKKPFDLLGQIFAGAIGVVSPEKGSQFFEGMCRFDAGLDALCAWPEEKAKVDLTYEMKEKWIVSKEFNALVEEKGYLMASVDTKSFPKWRLKQEPS
jgi:hypothetical protein